MHKLARVKLCVTLDSFDKNIAIALFRDSLLELVEAVNNFQKDRQMTKEQGLIIAFLREYPAACVAQEPNSFQSLRFILSYKLHTILKRRVIMLRIVAEILRKGLT